MIIFVTGGTGVLGRPTIERLVGGGHQVRALAHRPEAADRLRQLGAEPVPGNLFVAASLGTALAGTEAVVHLATRIPSTMTMGWTAAWGNTDRIRREGTRNLVDASMTCGVSAMVYPSVVLLYADAGDHWIDAETGQLDSPSHARSTLDAEGEVERFSAGGGRGVSLRLGLLYSPHDEVTAMQASMARLGIAMIAGPDNAYWPALWVDDAADAIVAATLCAPAGLYDVVDDRPLTRAELQRAMADGLGRRLRRLPGPVLRLMLAQLAAPLSRSLRVSNRRFVEASGWHPAVPDAIEGWRRIGATESKEWQ